MFDLQKYLMVPYGRKEKKYYEKIDNKNENATNPNVKEKLKKDEEKKR